MNMPDFGTVSLIVRCSVALGQTRLLRALAVNELFHKRAGCPPLFRAPAQRRVSAVRPVGRHAGCTAFFVGAWTPSVRANPERRDARRARRSGCRSLSLLSLTPGILPSALRAGFAVRVAPATQWASKEKCGPRSGWNALLLQEKKEEILRCAQDDRAKK